MGDAWACVLDIIKTATASKEKAIASTATTLDGLLLELTSMTFHCVSKMHIFRKPQAVEARYFAY